MKCAQADRSSRSLLWGAARQLPVSPGMGGSSGSHHSEHPWAGTRMASLCPCGSLYAGLWPQLGLHTAGCVQHIPTASVTCHGIERGQTASIPPGGWGGQMQQEGATGALHWDIRNPLRHNQAEVHPPAHPGDAEAGYQAAYL